MGHQVRGAPSDGRWSVAARVMAGSCPGSVREAAPEATGTAQREGRRTRGELRGYTVAYGGILGSTLDCQSRGRGFKFRRARQIIDRLGGGGVLSPPSTCPELALSRGAHGRSSERDWPDLGEFLT